jgi:hypothetical protein
MHIREGEERRPTKERLVHSHGMGRGAHRLLPVFLAVLVGGSAAEASTPGSAPRTPFIVQDSFGATQGTITWKGKSIHVQGFVRDASGQGTSVNFIPQPGALEPYSQRRQAHQGHGPNPRPFSFTITSPYAGDITGLRVYLCQPGAQGVPSCDTYQEYQRP